MAKIYIIDCGIMHTTLVNRKKELVFFVAHMDDFEFSCLAYLFKKHSYYESIKIIIASEWELKKDVWQDNLKTIESIISRNIEYVNLGFAQRKLTKNFEEVKDKFYSNIDFDSDFDIVTHDIQDAHSDHLSVNKAAYGIFKYCKNFITIYSPSSVNFRPNYYVRMTEQEFETKHELLTKYDFSKEQSFSKKGTYFRKQYTNIHSFYATENFINCDMDYCEVYKIYKWIG